jgi:hypothetical protein
MVWQYFSPVYGGRGGDFLFLVHALCILVRILVLCHRTCSKCLWAGIILPVFAYDLSSLNKGDINIDPTVGIGKHAYYVQCWYKGTCTTCIVCVVYEVVRCYSFTMYGELGTNIYPALSPPLYL